MVLGSRFPFIPPDTNGSNTEQSANVPRTNPKFEYPNKTIKFLDAQRSFDQSSSVPTPSAKRKFELQRGFIKNLQPATLKSMPVSKCYFQFNPQEIRQSVSMREDIYNPILLSAEQLSQPIGGNVTFQFDLFFDRSLELASNRRGPVPGTLEDAPNVATADASQVGVYADLRVLYDVIGQGINADLLELQRENLKSAYSAKLNRDKAYSSPSDSAQDNEDSSDEQVNPPAPSDFDSAAVTDVLNLNVGNRAFLIPNPVRIAFSKILMIDGFVTGTSVDFLKFNTDMVPMQCRVSLSVYAMYIGFAKQKTFLTSTLDEARTNLQQESVRDSAALAEVDQAILGNVIKPFKLAFEVLPDSDTSSTNWDESIQNGDVKRSYLYYYLMSDSEFNNVELDLLNETGYRIGYAGFPGIRPRGADTPDTDPILTLFENPNRSPFSIEYEWEFKVYCKGGQDTANGVGWTQAEARAALSNLSSAKVAARYSKLETASNKEQWGSGTTGGGASREKIRRRTYKNRELSNSGSYILRFDGARKTNIQNSYYVIEYNFNLIARAGTAEKIYGTAPFRRVVKGNEQFGIESNFRLNTSSTTTFYYSTQAG